MRITQLRAEGPTHSATNNGLRTLVDVLDRTYVMGFQPSGCCVPQALWAAPRLVYIVEGLQPFEMWPGGELFHFTA